MIRQVTSIAILFFMLTACSAPAPTWRFKATALVEELAQQDAKGLFPQEYNNLLETFEHGEAVLHVQEDDHEADIFYLLALQKGSVLKLGVARYKQLQAEIKSKLAAEEAARVEEERLMIQAAEAEVRLREQELLKASQEDQSTSIAKLESSKEPVTQQPSSYTVRRGETLPQIAARFEIYNDASLWPLIYRANRDQIRNPTQLWPGQALKIPRHFSRGEAIEAKRYSGKK